MRILAHKYFWITALLEAPHENGDIIPIRQMKKFYSLCTDTSNYNFTFLFFSYFLTWYIFLRNAVIFEKGSLNRNGLTPIFKILDQLGLPRFLPTSDITADLNLAQVLSRAQRLLNFDILIQLSIRSNSSSNINLMSVSIDTYLHYRCTCTWYVDIFTILSYLYNAANGEKYDFPRTNGFDRWVQHRMKSHFYQDEELKIGIYVIQTCPRKSI